MICQSACSSCSQATSSSSRSVWLRTSSVRDGTPASVGRHRGRPASPAAERFGRMAAMSGSYWKQVHADGLAVPSDRPLDDLTAELTRMLGDPDPALRDGIAYPTLATWIERGVYDDLLAGLGDGMAAGLRGRASASATPTRSSGAASRRWCSAECIARDNGRAAAARRQDPRVGRPARDLAAARARPARLRARQGLGARRRPRRRRARRPWPARRTSATPELTVLLDVIADRLLLPVDRLCHQRRARPAGARHDARCCAATWSRCGSWSRGSPGSPRPPATRSSYDDRDPYLAGGNAEAFLRALYLQLSLGAAAARGALRPAAGAWSTRCRRTNPHYLAVREPLRDS